MPGMRRREFVSLFGAAAVAWPARRERSAASEAADHRVLGSEHAYGHGPMGGRFCAAAA